MRISTKGRYALRLLLDLARHGDQGYVPLSAVSERQGISKKYLEQVVRKLGSAGLLNASKGIAGGYLLARDPSGITLGDILRLTENEAGLVPCVADPAKCPRSGNCKACAVWRRFSGEIGRAADAITLADML